MKASIDVPPDRSAAPISQGEQDAIDAFDTQRRSTLLRFLVPAFLIINMLSTPFALYTDIMGALQGNLTNGGGSALNFHFYGSVQNLLGLSGFSIAAFALRRRQVTLAAAAFFGGIAVNIFALILTDAFLPGPLALRSLPDFALLLIPIALAGILGDARQTAATIVFAVVFTISVFSIAPHDEFLRATLEQSDGIAALIVLVALQIALGIIIFAAARALRQTQRDLNAVRIAYARERELDRLKDQFISNINHELRTPIMSLQGYFTIAQELAHRGDLARLHPLLRRGQDALRHLTGLVESVLRVRQIEANPADFTPIPVQIRTVLDEALTLLDPRAANEQERPLRVALPPTLYALGDPERILQVLLNLLSNARKYSEPGTPIDITAPSSPRHGERAMVTISIRDFGHGIPPDQISLLFERFVRLERDLASPVVGSGLGLAICKAAVTAMGGTIWAESSGIPGEGTTFSFTLPAAE